jgi:uncharacterized membrane protein
MKRLTIVLIVAVFLCACESRSAYHRAPFDGNKCEIDVSNLKGNQPEFYFADLDGKTVVFFVLKVNGEIQSYFNACRECFRKNLGFRLDNGFIQCKACNVKYPVEALKDGIGSCYPIQLKGALRENRYVITREALIEGEKYF